MHPACSGIFSTGARREPGQLCAAVAAAVSRALRDGFPGPAGGHSRHRRKRAATTRGRELYARCRRAGARARAARHRSRRHGGGDAARIRRRWSRRTLAIPMAGAVLNALNTRLDAASIALSAQSRRGESADHAIASSRRRSRAALADVERKLLIIDVDDPVYDGCGRTDRCARLRSVSRRRRRRLRMDCARRRVGRDCAQLHVGHDRQSEGCRLLAPRRVYQRSVERAGVGDAAPSGVLVDTADVPLQRLVLSMDDRGNGRARTCVCERSRPRRCSMRFASTGSRTIAARRSCIRCWSTLPTKMKQGITHKVHAMVAAAAPPASMIEGMDRMGFDLTHVYGLTEVYGPATVCAKQPAWAAPGCRRARDEEQPPGRALHA